MLWSISPGRCEIIGIRRRGYPAEVTGGEQDDDDDDDSGDVMVDVGSLVVFVVGRASPEYGLRNVPESSVASCIRARAPCSLRLVSSGR